MSGGQGPSGTVTLFVPSMLGCSPTAVIQPTTFTSTGPVLLFPGPVNSTVNTVVAVWPGATGSYRPSHRQPAGVPQPVGDGSSILVPLTNIGVRDWIVTTRKSLFVVPPLWT